MKLSAAITPPREDCEDTALPPGFVPAPPQFVEPGAELRLIQPLRDVATLSARAIVARAAEAFYWQEHPSALPTQQGSTDLGNALADLAVTGRVAYASMSAEPPTEAALRPMVKTLLAPSVDASYTDVTRSINRALNRTYAVARALRGPLALRAARRAALGWIAVSSDDDPPHRPVNVPAPPFEQYEIPVTVRGVTARTRFLIASAVEPAATVATDPASHELPRDPQPEVPDGHRVILFLHGHSSAAEEALAIIPHIHSAGLEQGTRFSVISLDLPNNGYSETFAHTLVAPLADTSYPWKLTDKAPIRTPILDFIEDFVVAFVDALDEITPIKRRFAGVIGGSLGGNLGLRLGRRNLVASPWLEAGIVSWSAASVWDANVNDLVKSQAPKSCLDLCVAETEASRADYFQRVFFKDLHWTPGLGGTTGLNHPQPYFWYRDDWQPCKALHILGAHLARRETYNGNFRQWHWRVAGEQLIYSHVDRVQHDDETTPYRYQLNRVRQLLVAGDQDNGTGANIYEATRTLAGLMVNTPGESLFLRDTGHSIHAERPRFFGRTIVQFLSAVELPDRVAGVAAAVSLLLGEAPAPAAPAPAATYAAVSLLLS